MALDFPTNPTTGQQYSGYVFDGTKWKVTSTSTAPASIGTTAPVSASIGDMWWNSTDGTQYMYYNDGNTSQWVESRSAIISDGYYSPNYIINGGFDIWQRGTSSGWVNGYNSADRWYMQTGGSTSWAQESTVIAPGTRYSLKATTAASTQVLIYQTIETANTMPLAGTTATLSAYLASSASTAGYLAVQYSTSVDNGTAGSWTTVGDVSTSLMTTSVVRYSLTVTVPSTAKSLRIVVGTAGSLSSGNTFTVGGVQLEAGSVVTPFRRNGNSLQGELAACQRYYQRITSEVAYGVMAIGYTATSTSYSMNVPFKIPLRTAPLALDNTGTMSNYLLTFGGANYTIASMSLVANESNSNWAVLSGTNSTSGVDVPLKLIANGTTAAYIGFSAEL